MAPTKKASKQRHLGWAVQQCKIIRSLGTMMFDIRSKTLALPY